MPSLLRHFLASSIRVTSNRQATVSPLSAEGREAERVVDFFGAKIAFPNWNAEIEEEIRDQLNQLKGLDNAAKAAMARTLIVAYLDRDHPRDIPFATRSEALHAVSAHTWKVARARGIVCER